MKFKRVIAIVLDSVGIGDAPDAQAFNDEGADTLGHIGEYFKGDLYLPNLEKLGISNTRPEAIEGIPKADPALASYGRMTEISLGKDSLDGHWEMMGLPMESSFNFYPEGFPQDLIDKVEAYSGRPVVGNYPESGTVIIDKYGEDHLETGSLIVYTSGDSVFQIAAHEEVVPLEELYDICRYVRSLMNGPDHLIGRVIARPFVGTSRENFERTANRHDFALEPQGKTALDYLQEAGYTTIAIGKTYDIFSGQGFDEAHPTQSNDHGMEVVLETLQRDFTGFCFTNLVDFDSKYGHRRDPQGFGEALMAFDIQLGQVLEDLREDDLLMITADHGNDPTYKGTDHTRERVPLLAYSKKLTGNQNLGTRSTFADMGATVLDNFSVDHPLIGESFLSELI